MSSHLIAMTGSLIGVAGKFAMSLIIMVVSLKMSLFPYTWMYGQHWTLLEHVATDSKWCGQDGLLPNTPTNKSILWTCSAPRARVPGALAPWQRGRWPCGQLVENTGEGWDGRDSSWAAPWKRAVRTFPELSRHINADEELPLTQCSPPAAQWSTGQLESRPTLTGTMCLIIYLLHVQIQQNQSPNWLVSCLRLVLNANTLPLGSAKLQC